VSRLHGRAGNLGSGISASPLRTDEEQISPSKRLDDRASFRFTPAEGASGPRLLALALALACWPVSIALVVWVLATSYHIEVAMLITAGAFIIAFAYLGVSTWLTDRRRRALLERSPEDRR
jgi:hypothetical protein